MHRNTASTLSTVAFAVLASSSCAGSPPAPIHETTTTSERASGTAPATPTPTPIDSKTSPSSAVSSDAGADSCHVAEELSAAFSKIAPNEGQATWTQAARARLWAPVDAERALTGITQEIVSALAHKRYDKIAALAGPNGVCLRAAKGAPCQTLSARQLTGCAHSAKRTTWAVDTGRDEPPSYTCGEAFRRIFYARDFLRKGKPSYNCFPSPGRGNNASPIVMSGPARGYVELLDSGTDGQNYQSLWLVFDGEPDAPVLVEMISEYWGM